MNRHHGPPLTGICSDCRVSTNWTELVVIESEAGEQIDLEHYSAAGRAFSPAGVAAQKSGAVKIACQRLAVDVVDSALAEGRVFRHVAARR